MHKLWRIVILLLWSGWGLLGCLPEPREPARGQPYAQLMFPDDVRLVFADTQSIDTRLRLRSLRLSPGLHRLRFAYAGRHPQYAGQGSAFLCLEIHAGQQYTFEAKTIGIMWRPAIATVTLIPDYCQSHACTEAERHIPSQPPVILLCPPSMQEERPATTHQERHDGPHVTDAATSMATR